MIQRTPPPPSSAPAYAALSDALRSRILDGSLLPGDRLPAPEDLAATHGIGRSTVREAIRRLEAERLVVTTRGVYGGTFVHLPDPADLAETITDGLLFLTVSPAVGVDHLLEARAVLEVPAVALAATRADGDALAAVAATLGAEAPADTFTSNRDFHTTLLAATGNPLLGTLAMPLFDVLGSRYRRDPEDTTTWGRVTAEHQGILEAVRRGDADTASTRMRAHLETLRDTYRELEGTT